MSKKTIVFKSSDGESFEVEEAVVEQFQAIKDMFDDISTVTTIPLNNISGEIFAKVVEYCRRHSGASEEEDLNSFDADFVKVDHPILSDLILAANYLNVKGLLDLTCEALAAIVAGKTPAEIRTFFNIAENLTPEEEEALQL